MNTITKYKYIYYCASESLKFSNNENNEHDNVTKICFETTKQLGTQSQSSKIYLFIYHDHEITPKYNAIDRINQDCMFILIFAESETHANELLFKDNEIIDMYDIYHNSDDEDNSIPTMFNETTIYELDTRNAYTIYLLDITDIHIQPLLSDIRFIYEHVTMNLQFVDIPIDII